MAGDDSRRSGLPAAARKNAAMASCLVGINARRATSWRQMTRGRVAGEKQATIGNDTPTCMRHPIAGFPERSWKHASDRAMWEFS